jgi:adenosine deaminase
MNSAPKDLQQANQQGNKLKPDELKRLELSEKVELHRHLEGSLRLATLLELAPQVGIEVPIGLQLQSEKFLVTRPLKDLVTVLNKFWMTQSVLISEEILSRITYEAIEDAYQDGIRILELRYSPTFIQKNHDNLSFAAIHRAICKGVKQAEHLPLAVGLICILQRTLPLPLGESVCDFAIENKDSFVGIDLADDEDAAPTRAFEKIFKRAHVAGLSVTIHAGESSSPSAPQNVLDAIQILQAQRIGHGVQSIKNPEIMRILSEKKIPLELCLTSNWLTAAVPHLHAHPFRELMRAGVLVTINSDDPGIFGISLNHEYRLLRENFDLTDEEFDRCNDIAAHASFIPLAQKQKYWPRLIKSF